MNGGGNDVNDKCDCNACEGVIDKMISSDATTGKLPSLVSQIQQNGNKVVFVMYPQIPIGAQYGFDRC
ncbi:MAG: acyl-CoA thioesterase-1 [Urechidicola sp.]|jgi:acyl-CoA thioesterase-1